jgi:hypothetical protein
MSSSAANFFAYAGARRGLSGDLQYTFLICEKAAVCFPYDRGVSDTHQFVDSDTYEMARRSSLDKTVRKSGIAAWVPR